MSPRLAVALPKLAVMPLAGKGVEERVTATLTDLITIAIASTKCFEVTSADEIQALLGLERMKDSLGCDNVSCMADIGGALGSDQMLTGNAGRLGDRIVLKLVLFDTKRLKVIRRAVQSLSADENTYEQGARLALWQLFPDQKLAAVLPPPQQLAPPNAVLLVETTPTGAHLTVDGKAVGFAPLQKNLAAGSHAIQASLAGFVDVSRRIQLSADEALRVSLTLEEVPMAAHTMWGHLAFWPGVLLAAVAGGATLLARQTADRYYAGELAAGDANHVWSAVAVGGYVVGAAGIVGGAGLWLF
jgi:hypothetical protein